ncbi:MAG: hypothetical protein ACO3KD_06915 [Gaiellales bacterium]
MDWEPGARGTIIAGRYRASGELRRRGMIEATDLEAPPQRAACRLIGVPGDPQAVDDWQRAWVDAEGAARLPSLRAVVRDEDGAAWAVIDPATADSDRSLPADAHGQARAIGAALARAGLDPGDVTAAMLEVGTDGLLRIEGPVWLGGELPPTVAGERLAALLPEPPGPAWEADPAPSRERRPPRRRRDRRRGLRRLGIAGIAFTCLAGTGLAVALPTRSQEIAPAPTDAVVVQDGADALLGSVVVADPVAPPPASVAQEPEPVPLEPEPAPRTVTVVVTVEAPPSAAGEPDPAAVDLPLAGSEAPALPAPAADAPLVPAIDGW